MSATADRFKADATPSNMAGVTLMNNQVGYVVAKVMKDKPGMKVSVEGHTDSIGSEAYNQRLSERRAQAVRDYMIENGISPGRVATRGFGKSRPVASNETAEGRAQNRRVEIIAE